jgi:hypothetical protein
MPPNLVNPAMPRLLSAISPSLQCQGIWPRSRALPISRRTHILPIADTYTGTETNSSQLSVSPTAVKTSATAVKTSASTVKSSASTVKSSAPIESTTMEAVFEMSTAKTTAIVERIVAKAVTVIGIVVRSVRNSVYRRYRSHSLCSIARIGASTAVLRKT